MEKNVEQKKHLRKIFREKRAQLSLQTQLECALEMTRCFAQTPVFTQAKSIAFYWPNDNEINPVFLMDFSFFSEKECYLPRIATDEAGNLRQLHFAQYFPGQDLAPNRFGILEPTLLANTIPLEDLDIVCVPLVAFNTFGERLGMGGGFYDFNFAFKKNNHTKKPYLIGLAYDCQECDKRFSDEWDIKLEAVVTESQFIICSPGVTNNLS